MGFGSSFFGVECPQLLMGFQAKLNLDGILSKHKSRLVANGMRQQDCLDYDQTFVPIVKPVIVQIILLLTINHGWKLHQMDVSNAFLYGFLDEDVFMRQPLGFLDSGHFDLVCKLQCSIYDLKQSPRAWFHHLKNAIVNLGFVESLHDESLFVYR